MSARLESMARAAHEANRSWCLAHGDMSQPSWDDAPDWQRSSAIKGVEGALAGNTPEQSHEGWTAEKIVTGWVYGLVKNPGAKEYLCLVPYNELPSEQRAKDAIFLGVVRAVAAAWDATLVLLACLVLPALALTLSGCGTWADRARTTIEVSAVAVDVADHALADALTSTCASVADLPARSSERAAALDACLAAHHYDDALTAIRVADRALRAAQAAVDAGVRADDEAPWRETAACVAVAVAEVLAAVQAAGVDVPPALTTGASLLAAYTGTCAATSPSADEPLAAAPAGTTPLARLPLAPLPASPSPALPASARALGAASVGPLAAAGDGRLGASRGRSSRVDLLGLVRVGNPQVDRLASTVREPLGDVVRLVLAEPVGDLVAVPVLDHARLSHGLSPLVAVWRTSLPPSESGAGRGSEGDDLAQRVDIVTSQRRALCGSGAVDPGVGARDLVLESVPLAILRVAHRRAPLGGIGADHARPADGLRIERLASSATLGQCGEDLGGDGLGGVGRGRHGRHGLSPGASQGHSPSTQYVYGRILTRTTQFDRAHVDFSHGSNPVQIAGCA
ncbi:MAG TPA: RyR domain-containing protein [Gaiellaceae bacterium]|nr:RyR domain-containing protein [Gaiellaceae bacterium]